MKTLVDFYNNPSEFVSFEGLKLSLSKFHLQYKTLVKSDRSIKISFLNPDKRRVGINVDIMRELVSLEKDLHYYYSRAGITISKDIITIDVEF